MIVENFADKDVEAASKIAHLVWGDLYTHESKKLQKLIYDFMVKYYDLNRKYSFALHNDDFKGFILTNTKFDKIAGCKRTKNSSRTCRLFGSLW